MSREGFTCKAELRHCARDMTSRSDWHNLLRARPVNGLRAVAEHAGKVHASTCATILLDRAQLVLIAGIAFMAGVVFCACVEVVR